MKQFGAFTQDTFKASVEFQRFNRAAQDDIYKALATLVGTATVFISGGEITITGGNTTITNGVICKDGKFYDFVGGTFTGLPTVLKVKFDTQTASGFPVPYFGNTQIDVYQNNTAIVDAGGAIFLGDIGRIKDLKTITDEIAPITTHSTLAINVIPPFVNHIVAHRDGRTVTLRANNLFYEGGATTQHTPIITLPELYRPSVDTFFNLMAIPAVGYHNSDSNQIVTNIKHILVAYSAVDNQLKVATSLPNSVTDEFYIAIPPITYSAE